jgi:hypothetical protein
LDLVPRSKKKNVIGTKWVYIKKLNEDRQIVINKERLVCKGYSQVGVEFEETFTHVAIIEDIQMFVDFACYRKFRVYMMDVKSAFLNGDLEEKFYVEQLEGFQLTKKEDYVYRLNKSMYGIKHVPRDWYYY